MKSDIIDLDDPRYLVLRAQARDTNVNSQTLLATDYLNHFNEVIMLIEMTPDMPDMLPEVQAWRPVGYQDHFRNSGIADRELAIEAYDFVPGNFKGPFEKTVKQLNDLVATAVGRLEQDMGTGNMAITRENAALLSQTLKRLADVANAIIHGSEGSLAQAEIDTLLGN